MLAAGIGVVLVLSVLGVAGGGAGRALQTAAMTPAGTRGAPGTTKMTRKK